MKRDAKSHRSPNGIQSCRTTLSSRPTPDALFIRISSSISRRLSPGGLIHAVRKPYSSSFPTQEVKNGGSDDAELQLAEIAFTVMRNAGVGARGPSLKGRRVKSSTMRAAL